MSTTEMFYSSAALKDENISCQDSGGSVADGRGVEVSGPTEKHENQTNWNYSSKYTVSVSTK